jgi:succinoglycan biosynthesis transport protein ExoP
MGMKDYLRILRRSWPLIVVMAIVGLAAGWAVSSTTPPQYSATSAAFVSSDRSGTLNELTQGNAFTVQRVSTYAKLATEPIVTQPVIEDFGLNMTPSEFASKVTVTIPVDTTMIEITVEDESASLASSLANAVMTSLKTTVADIETPTAGQTAPDGTVISKPAPPVKITQVRFAEVPTKPISPNVLLNLCIGLLAGIALGALGAVVRELLDSRIRNLDDLEALTSVPVVGVIPQRPRTRLATDLAHGDPGNSFDESFRILRTNLQFLDVDGPATFVLTSASGGDGKSTVTANLAVSIAANGLRVLVVDADLRRPQVHDYFAIEGGAGLTDILIGRAELADVVQPWRSERLHLLAAGRIPPNPSELLGSAHMRELMVQLQERYDVVLYDCAPVLPVPDAAILSRQVGGVLLVTSIDRSKRDQVRSALGALQKVNAKVSGVIANRLSVRGATSYLADPYHSHSEDSLPGEPDWNDSAGPAPSEHRSELAAHGTSHRDR